MASRKRQLDEPDKLIEVDQPVNSANIHGAVTSLSPVKKGCRASYFDGTIADDSTELRLVGFSSEHQRQISTFFRSKTPINLKNCIIKLSREGHKMEIMLKSNTRIIESNKNIDVSGLIKDSATVPSSITISELASTQNFQHVSLQVKVVEAKEPTYVGEDHKHKQDLIVADSTGLTKLALWEKDVGTMQKQHSYSLVNVIVREYKSKKYLSKPKDGAVITTIDDIGDVQESDSETDEPQPHETRLSNVWIIGVPQLDSYKSCLMCKARVEPMEPPLGRCSKCSVMQRFDLCPEQCSAKLLLMSDSDHNRIYPLHGFGRTIRDLAGANTDSAVTPEALLNSPLIS